MLWAVYWRVKKHTFQTNLSKYSTKKSCGRNNSSPLGHHDGNPWLQVGRREVHSRLSLRTYLRKFYRYFTFNSLATGNLQSGQNHICSLAYKFCHQTIPGPVFQSSPFWIHSSYKFISEAKIFFKFSEQINTEPWELEITSIAKEIIYYQNNTFASSFHSPLQLSR